MTAKLIRHLSAIRSMLIIVGLVLVCSNTLLFSLVPSCSMEPTLVPGSYLMCRRNPITVAHGDIILFTHDRDKPHVNGLLQDLALRLARTDVYVKRVIGLPGDQVDIRFSEGKGELYCNGNLISTTEIVDYSSSWQMDKHETTYGTVYSTVVPANHYYVIGDNVNDSYDSRYYGAISADQVLARCVWSITPIPIEKPWPVDQGL